MPRFVAAVQNLIARFVLKFVTELLQRIIESPPGEARHHPRPSDASKDFIQAGFLKNIP